MTGALVADTGGLLRAIAATPQGKPAWPEYSRALQSASAVVVPAMVLAESDYFLRKQRPAMRRLVGEIFDPATRYEFEPTDPADIVRALNIDARFANLELGLVDGVVAAVAERRRISRVLTTDRRDFGALRIGPRYDKAMILVP